jgi:hypothetical protein
MSKYNLIDILEGMSNDEWEAAKEADRLEAHPDRDKIKAIQAMFAKEREVRKDVKEVTGDVFNRIDGLTNQVLKQQFLIKFSEIYEDLVEGGDLFDVSDVIQYLTSQMQEFAFDTRMDNGEWDNEDLNESTGPSDKSEPEDDVDNVDNLASPDAKAKDYGSAVSAGSNQNDLEGKEDAQVAPMFEEEDDIAKLQKIADDTSKMPKERDEARQKMYALKKQKMETKENKSSRPGYHADGTPKSNDEMSDDEREAFYNDSDFIDEDEALKEHFGRFLKDYQ